MANWPKGGGGGLGVGVGGVSIRVFVQGPHLECKLVSEH